MVLKCRAQVGSNESRIAAHLLTLICGFEDQGGENSEMVVLSSRVKIVQWEHELNQNGLKGQKTTWRANSPNSFSKCQHNVCPSNIFGSHKLLQNHLQHFSVHPARQMSNTSVILS